MPCNALGLSFENKNTFVFSDHSLMLERPFLACVLMLPKGHSTGSAGEVGPGYFLS